MSNLTLQDSQCPQICVKKCQKVLSIPDKLSLSLVEVTQF